MSNDLTTNRPGIYSMGQLSVKPSRVPVPASMVLRSTYGRSEQEMLAALLITMYQQKGDVWQGFTLHAISERVGEEHVNSRVGQGSALFFNGARASEVLTVGLRELIEREMLQVEPEADGNRAYDVIFPTEELLKPLRHLIIGA
jgi:hypothetical protein